LPAYVREAGLWFTVADTGPIGDEHLARVRALVEAAGPDGTAAPDRTAATGSTAVPGSAGPRS